MASVAAEKLLEIAANLREVTIDNLNMAELIKSIKEVLDKVDYVAALDFRASSNKKTFQELIASVLKWMDKLNSCFTSQNLVEADIISISELAKIGGPAQRIAAIKPFTRLFRTVLDLLKVIIERGTVVNDATRSELVELTYIVADKCDNIKDFVTLYEQSFRLTRVVRRTFGRL
jgi:hypothetical protein